MRGKGQTPGASRVLYLFCVYQVKGVVCPVMSKKLRAHIFLRHGSKTILLH